MSARPRLGHIQRPDREWEVYNAKFANRFGDDRWVAYHPADDRLSADGFDSLEEALDHVAVMESLHADRLERWRRGRGAA